MSSHLYYTMSGVYIGGAREHVCFSRLYALGPYLLFSSIFIPKIVCLTIRFLDIFVKFFAVSFKVSFNRLSDVVVCIICISYDILCLFYICHVFSCFIVC